MLNNHTIPGLSEAAVSSLNFWRNPKHVISGVDINEAILIEAQNVKGRGKFCFGISDQQWSTAQDRRLKSVGRRNPGRHWASQMTRQAWLVLHQMWGRRSKVLHQDDAGLRKDEWQAIDQATQEELGIVLEGLPQELSGFFRLSANSLLNSNPSAKARWLASAWRERGEVRRDQSLSRRREGPIASLLLARNKVRRKWK